MNGAINNLALSVFRPGNLCHGGIYTHGLQSLPPGLCRVGILEQLETGDPWDNLGSGVGDNVACVGSGFVTLALSVSAIIFSV